MRKLQVLDSRAELHPALAPPAGPLWRWSPDARLIRISSGDYELPNFATGTTMTVDAATGKAIATFSGVTTSFELPSGLGERAVAALKQGKYIVPAEKFEAYERMTRERIVQTLKGSHGFIIMPTEKCNFRCTYCYESFEKGRMKPELADVMSRAIRKRAESADLFGLGFFGGEPLMCSDLVRRFSAEAFEVMQRRGLPYGASMSTNGWYLEPPLFKQLVDVGLVAFQISIDGDRSMHDQQRVTVAGGETFGRIVDNLIAMQESREEFLAIIRCNLHEEHLERVIRLFEGEELRKLRTDRRFMVDIHPIFSSDKQDLSNPSPERSGCSVDIKRQLDFFLVNRELEKLGISTVPYRKMPALLQSACYAGKPNWFIVGPDLALYKCTVVFDRPENRVGYVDDAGNLVVDMAKNDLWTGSNVTTDGGCGACHYRVPCGGIACPLTRFTDGVKQCPGMKSPDNLRRWAENRPRPESR